jgi:hypothetical protein
VAYFWSARTPISGSWREEVARFVATIPGVVLDVAEGRELTIRLYTGASESVQFRFVRQRGGGAVTLTSGSKLVLVSLAVALRLKLGLSDTAGEALETHDARALLARIAFTESAAEIERLAEEVGLLPRRVRLAALSASPRPKHGGVFFA